MFQKSILPSRHPTIVTRHGCPKIVYILPEMWPKKQREMATVLQSENLVNLNCEDTDTLRRGLS